MSKHIKRMHRAYRSDKTHIGYVYVDELERFCSEMVKAVGEPPNKRNIISMCWNSVCVSAPKAYREKCIAFYKGWMAAKPSSVCDVLIDPNWE